MFASILVSLIQPSLKVDSTKELYPGSTKINPNQSRWTRKNFKKYVWDFNISRGFLNNACKNKNILCESRLYILSYFEKLKNNLCDCRLLKIYKVKYL